MLSVRFPVADKVLNAPVDGVVAPTAQEFRPVEVSVPRDTSATRNV